MFAVENPKNLTVFCCNAYMAIFYNLENRISEGQGLFSVFFNNWPSLEWKHACFPQINTTQVS